MLDGHGGDRDMREAVNGTAAQAHAHAGSPPNVRRNLLNSEIPVFTAVDAHSFKKRTFVIRP
jgi:hypothetical protein